MHDIILGNGYNTALGYGRKMGLDYARSGLWLRQHASPWFERDVINSKPILWLRGPRGLSMFSTQMDLFPNAMRSWGRQELSYVSLSTRTGCLT
jgi:hypothetical protein